MRQIAGISQDVIRAFLTLLAPGAVALAPWIGLAAHARIAGFADFLDDPSGAAIFLGIVAASTVGLVLDDIGTRIEYGILETRIRKPDYVRFNVRRRRILSGKLRRCEEKHHYSNLDETWLAYLQLHYPRDDEPYGQHYIRTVLLKLKFELATGVGLVLAIPAYVWLGLIRPLMSWGWLASTSGLIFVASLYLLWESYGSALGLAKHRKNLVDGARREAARP